MNRALIVIDVQESFRQLPLWQASSNPDIVGQVNRLVAHARDEGDLVVWVLHSEPGTGGVPPLAEMLGLPAERAEGLFPGLYQELDFVPEMTDAVEALRRSGVRTGVLSNSWWFPMYDRPFYARAFDVQIVSGLVGLRKPERAMFEKGLEELGIAAERVFFVDDFEENLPPAQELGMSVFLHDPDDPARTIAELERRFGVMLPPG